MQVVNFLICLCNNISMDSRTKIRLYFLAELLVWIVVIALATGGIRYAHMKKQSEYKAYRIFMEDVDGLIEGSPVRMLGTQIGYIKTVKIVRGMVYVKFLITDKTVALPKGVIATVEFNGMAGSKSLELYPPDEFSKAENNLVSIKKTNRLSNALGLLDNMVSKFMSIIVRCQVFAESVGMFDPKPPISEKPINKFKAMNDMLDKYSSDMDNYKIQKENLKKKLDYTKRTSKPIILNMVEEDNDDIKPE